MRIIVSVHDYYILFCQIQLYSILILMLPALVLLCCAALFLIETPVSGRLCITASAFTCLVSTAMTVNNNAKCNLEPAAI